MLHISNITLPIISLQYAYPVINVISCTIIFIFTYKHTQTHILFTPSPHTPNIHSIFSTSIFYSILPEHMFYRCIADFIN